MSVFTSIFGSKPGRHRTQAWTRAAQALHSRLATRTRWYRRILAICLAALALVSFIEVVLMPGKLIRRHFESVSIAPAAPPDVTSVDDPQVRLPFGLQTEEQKTKQRQEQLDRVHERLQAAHQQLDELYQKLLAASEASESYCQTKLTVVPSVSTGSTVPKCLVDVVANEPTAQVAWAQLLATQAQATAHLRAARELLDAVAGHFASGSFLPEDEHDMLALLTGMQQSLSDVDGSRDCVDHIVTLQRARAALAHQAQLEDNLRNSP